MGAPMLMPNRSFAAKYEKMCFLQHVKELVQIYKGRLSNQRKLSFKHRIQKRFKADTACFS
jgi:hypothetical protein